MLSIFDWPFYTGFTVFPISALHAASPSDDKGCGGMLGGGGGVAEGANVDDSPAPAQ